MFEAEIMITGYTILVATCTLGISKLLCRKRANRIQSEISDLKASLVRLKEENRTIKIDNNP